MKKTVVITFLFLAVVVAALPIACGKIDSEKECIVITEEVLTGDSAAAAGITLQVATCLGRGLNWSQSGRRGEHLLWDTAYTIGSGESAESEFTFSSQVINWKRQDTDSYISCSLLPNFGASYMGRAGEDSAAYAEMPLAEIVHDVADRTKAGERHQEMIRIGDYYPYYPIWEFAFRTDKNIRYQEDSLEEDYFVYLTEFFHIPTEEDMLEVTVEKSEEGYLVFVEVGRNLEGLSVSGVSAFGEKGCYYTYACGDMKAKEYVDRGQNSGIFYIPYVQEEEYIVVGRNQIRKVCGMPEGRIPSKMVLDEEKGYMYLGCRGEDAFYLDVYALEENVPVFREEIQVLQGYAGEDGEVNFPVWDGMTIEEGGLLMTWQDNRFTFVAEENGGHRLWYSGSFPADGREESIASQGIPGEEKLQKFLQSRSRLRGYAGHYDYKQTIQSGNDSFTYGNACLFDGERLVLASLVNWKDANVLLAVYREDGLAYCGLYRHSGTQSVYTLDMQNTVQPQGAAERGCVRLSAGDAGRAQ